MALLPPFLQNLLGYPVLTAGWVMMPRGMGTMIGMFIVGRLVGKVERAHPHPVRHWAHLGVAVADVAVRH